MPDLFLIAPADAEPAAFATALSAFLAEDEASALLLPRGDRPAPSYAALIAAVLPIAQGQDVAVLIEGTPDDVRRLGADGLHIRGGIGDVRAAVAGLKPEFIVGAVASGTRHDAMDKAELDIDYVFFGPLSGPIDPATRELAQWWAETMQVPSVLSDPEALADGDAGGCEFLGIGEKLWESLR